MKVSSICILIAILLLCIWTAGCVSSGDDVPEIHTQEPTTVTLSPTPTVLETTLPTTSATTQPTTIKKTLTPTVTPTVTTTPDIYYVNKDSKIVHRSTCKHIKDPSNYLVVNDPSGYKKCNWW